jgi:hypothetical protein
MIMKRVCLVGACAGLVLTLSGCPNPNMYTTPRTLDPGTVQWQVAPEFIGVNYNTNVQTVDANGNPITVRQSESFSTPMVPSFGARIGLVDGFDLGLRLQNLDSFAADFKIRLFKSMFDVALDPGLQGFYATVNNTSAGVVYFHVPVLLGVNFSDRVSLVLTPGFVYSVTSATATNASGATGAATATGVMGRLGIGLDFRITKKFAIHPELTFMKQFTGDQDLLLWVGGIGFNIGAQPDYSDLATGEGSPPPPPAPAPAPAQPPPTEVR